jgi:hypothetical protein
MRQGVTLVPVKALSSLDATNEPRCPAVSKVHNGMLGLAQRAAYITRTRVSKPESQLRCFTPDTSAIITREQSCVPNKLARLG